MLKRKIICIILASLVTSSIAFQTASAGLNENCSFGESVHSTGYSGTNPSGWVITSNAKPNGPYYSGETNYMCINGAKYGDTANTISLYNLPPGWFVTGHNTTYSGQFRHVIKYLLGANIGATERIERANNNLSALTQNGWNITENDPNSSTILIQYVGSSKDYGKTMEIPYSAPVPENYVVIADKGSTKVIKFIPVIYSTPFSVEQVTLGSPIPRGWFQTAVFLDRREITSAFVYNDSFIGRTLKITAPYYDRLNGYEQWIATEKTPDGYILSFFGSFGGYPDNVTHRFRALRGTFVPDGFWVEDYGDPQYVNFCIRVQD